MKKLLAIFATSCLSALQGYSQTLEEAFLNPPQEARPIMIWQWMDGVVSSEGITADLEAYAEAGLGGVQQFHVGGPMQCVIRDTTNAVGTEPWKRLMRHALSECQRLGLSFGTHNCPGWSSSAYPTVAPEYSMQQLVWTDTIITINGKKAAIHVSQPEEKFGFYRDIAVLAMPIDSTVSLEDIVVLSMDNLGEWYGKLASSKDTNGRKKWRILRFGHTSNGKTNEATAPYGGVGLECDKMSREAVLRYWQDYPQMLIALASGTEGTFQRIEIDSYEAGGQSWTAKMPEEFSHRRGYDLIKWLPVMAGYRVESAERSKQFSVDFANTGTELFSENYYGYMGELAHEAGLKLLYQPYGTSSSRPFNPISAEGIASRLPDDYFCTEFWTNPTNWGWPSVPRHMQTAHKLGLQRIFAEGFTAWPLGAWQEDAASQKILADRAFCLGVNSLMLHAGAQNPWKGALPGMTFGKWGSWWTPGQTWWRSGAAKMLFGYMARCQSLLQRGAWADDYRSGGHSLSSSYQELQWTHRKDGDADVYFISNPLDSAVSATISIASVGRQPEIWNPQTGTMADAPAWATEGDMTRMTLKMDEHASLFIVLRRPATADAPGLALQEPTEKTCTTIDGQWTLRFPNGWDAPAEVQLDSLAPWNENADEGIRYFSGTATYSKTIRLRRIDKDARYILDLGEVKNSALVRLNGNTVAHLWTKPFRCDVTDYVRKGDNLLEIEVTNLWVNRMIGDEQYEDDIEWSETLRYEYAPGNPEAGRYMSRIPDWLAQGTPRPSQHRKTIVSFKFFRKDSPLIPSGLLGPVVLKTIIREN